MHWYKIMEMNILRNFNRSCFDFGFLNLWLKLLPMWHIQYTWYAYGGCQPRCTIAMASFILWYRSEIRHRPCFLVTCSRMFPKNHDQVLKVSPSTMTKASAKRNCYHLVLWQLRVYRDTFHTGICHQLVQSVCKNWRHRNMLECPKHLVKSLKLIFYVIIDNKISSLNFVNRF